MSETAFFSELSYQTSAREKILEPIRAAAIEAVGRVVDGLKQEQKIPCRQTLVSSPNLLSSRNSIELAIVPTGGPLTWFRVTKGLELFRISVAPASVGILVRVLDTTYCDGDRTRYRSDDYPHFKEYKAAEVDLTELPLWLKSTFNAIYDPVRKLRPVGMGPRFKEAKLF